MRSDPAALLLGADAQQVGVRQHLAAADVERLPHRARLVEHADQVLDDVADRDRLDPRANPAGVTITGSLCARSRAISNEALPEPTITPARSSVTGVASPPPSRSASPVSWRLRRCSERGVLAAAEAPEVDDPLDAGRGAGAREVARVSRVDVGERVAVAAPAGGAHRVHEVVGEARALDGRGDGGGSPRSPRTISRYGCALKARPRSFPGRRASARTGSPRSSSAAIRRPPTYPVAPVTRIGRPGEEIGTSPAPCARPGRAGRSRASAPVRGLATTSAGRATVVDQ